MLVSKEFNHPQKFCRIAMVVILADLAVFHLQYCMMAMGSKVKMLHEDSNNESSNKVVDLVPLRINKTL